jgi:hypothetical protein
MTVRTSLTIHCDGPDCDCPPIGFSTWSVEVARKQAADAGWTHKPETDTDWAPGHRPWIKITEVSK